mgnify:CR=1 FL=1
MRRFKIFRGLFQFVQKSVGVFRFFSGTNCFRGPKPRPAARCSLHLRDASPKPWRWLA